MNENKKTIIFAGVAIGLALLAFIFSPAKITPDAFLDQGEAFFPDFENPNDATSLEVIEYDENSGRPYAFKVVFANGKWSIPSHYDYPADGKDRLANTAAGVIDITKDDYRSNNVSDYESLGVLDPMDETGSLEGRGKRVTIKAEDGTTLADIIVGHEVEGRPNMRYVRLPDEKRVYATRMNIDISTRFEDWIKADLLETTKDDIGKVVINDYSINERNRSVDRRDNIQLIVRDSVWSANGMKSSQQIDTTVMGELLTTLDELTIVGIRPKPDGLSSTLKKVEGQADISQQDRRSLQGKGFFFTGDGQLMSNEGELQVLSSKGVLYTLRFGEVVHGSGLAVTAGTEEGADQTGGSAQNRYLFVSTEFNESQFREPPKPPNTDFLQKADSLFTESDRNNKMVYDAHSQWQRAYDRGKKLSQNLNDRFAEWYYVISAESFDKLHRSRSELIVSKN